MKIHPCEDHMSKIEFHKRSFKKINLSEGHPVRVTGAVCLDSIIRLDSIIICLALIRSSYSCGLYDSLIFIGDMGDPS